VVLSDAKKTALKSTYERAIWLLPCCGLHPLTGVSGESAAQMPYRLSRKAHSSSCRQAEGQEGPCCCKRDDDVDLRRLRLTMRLTHWSVCPSQVAPMTWGSVDLDDSVRRVGTCMRWGGQIARSTRYSRCANEPMAVRQWQKSRRIYVRPRPGPQSAHLWWPAVAKLQAASVPIA